MRIRVFTSFSGYDSQLMALRDIGADYECVGWSEIDKWAIKAHDAVFPELAGRNYGDITKIDWNAVSDFDLFTYSFPCTDISIAGKQKGFDEGSDTRSSLLWACRQPIASKRPKFLLMENVKALASEKYRPLFLKWESWLRSLGYVNYTEVLNAKDYGVPQNRERVFMLSVLNGNWYEFPHPVRLGKRLKDVLESTVDKKYFLSEAALKNCCKRIRKIHEYRRRCINVLDIKIWREQEREDYFRQSDADRRNEGNGLEPPTIPGIRSDWHQPNDKNEIGRRP